MEMRRIVSFWSVIFALFLLAGCFPDERPPQEEKVTPSVTPPVVQRAVTLPVEPPPVTWDDYEQAVYFYTIGRHEKAADLLARIRKLVLTDRQYRLLNFLSGLNTGKLNRPEQVEIFLAGDAVVPESLKYYAEYFTGRARFDTRQYREARDWLNAGVKTHPNWPLADRARLLSAEALFHLGDGSGALKEIRPLLKTKLEGPAMLVMARIYEGQNQLLKARDQYLLAMKNSNVREVRAEAAYKYKTLLYPVIDGPGHESEKQVLVRLLRTEWRLEEAIALIEKLEASGGSPGFLQNLAEEKALDQFFSGRIQDALPYYQANKNQAGQAWMYARCLKRLGHWEDAAAAFQSAGRKSRTSKCKYEAGLCYLKLGDLGKAQKAWGSVAYKKSGYRDDVLWQLGHFHFQRKEWASAENRFQSLIKERRKSGYARAARYWLARSMEAQGKATKAKEIYRDLAGSEEDYYYRMLAEQRLGFAVRSNTWPDQRIFQELISPENFGGTAVWAYNHPADYFGDLKTQRSLARNLSAIPLASPSVNQSIERLYDLCDAGAMDLALLEAEFLNDLIKRKRPPSARPYSKLSKKERGELQEAIQNLKTRLLGLICTCLVEGRRYDRFLSLQYKYLHQMKNGLSDAEQAVLRRRLYPLAYPGEIGEASHKTGLHPALILALMRTESNYQPDIMSVANARGLMQILPATGEKIAERMGEPAPSLDELFDPELNIRYGAWYLATLTEEFGGQYPLAIASYNGGPFNVKRWVEQAGPVSLEEFIETIPFDQTRMYVKKVLGTFYLYRLLFIGQVHTPDLNDTINKTFKGSINF